MKYRQIIPLFIFITCTISGMHLQYFLPDQSTITKRLWDAGFSNFAQESEIGAKLGNKWIEPIVLYGDISEILRRYTNSYPFIIAAWDHTSIEPYPPVCPNRSQLIRLLLQDYPRAIEALENNQWIEHNENIIGKDRPNWKKKLSSYVPCTNK